MKKETSTIKISDKHYLKADSSCMWIEEEYEVEKGSTKGEVVSKRVSGYGRDYETIFNSFYDRKCRDIDVNTAKQYLKEMASEREKTRKLIKKLLEELEREK